MAEVTYASNGKGNLGVTLGSIGTALGVFGNGLGNLFGGMGMGSEDGTLDLDRMEQELTKLMDKYGRLQITFLGRDIALDQSDVQKIADLCRKL